MIRKKGLIVNKKLKNFDYVDYRYRENARKRKEWDHFYMFECSDFFKGKTLARLNMIKYDEAMKPLWREQTILERMIDRFLSEE